MAPGEVLLDQDLVADAGADVEEALDPEVLDKLPDVGVGRCRLDRVRGRPVVQDDGDAVRVVELLRPDLAERLAHEVGVLVRHEQVWIGFYDLAGPGVGLPGGPAEYLLGHRPSGQRYANSTRIFNRDFRARG
ncbi:MAG: hypothetical protein MUE55_08840, partial [Thermoplasmata archaeon]|nr:hypothetical protein [Thermoplasmata archaeon]